jgi:hypothetical protein
VHQEVDYSYLTPIGDNIGSCADDDATLTGRLSFSTDDASGPFHDSFYRYLNIYKYAGYFTFWDTAICKGVFK